MWIETTNRDDDGTPRTERLKPPWLDDEVNLLPNGKEQVTDDVGERLIDWYPSIVESGSVSTSAAEADAESDTDDSDESADASDADDSDGDAAESDDESTADE